MSKYYMQAVELLTGNGLSDSEAVTVARLANGYRTHTGMDDASVGETDVKLKGKSATVKTTVKKTVKFDAGKQPVGIQAMEWISIVYAAVAYGPASFTLPDCFAGAHKRFTEEASAAKTKAGKAEKQANAEAIEVTTVDTTGA